MATIQLWGGRIVSPEREVSGLGLDGLQEVGFNCRLRGGAVRGGGKSPEVPNIGEWQCPICGAAHCWNTRLSCYRCGTPRYWLEWVFFGQGGVGSAMGGMRVVGTTGRDQTYSAAR